MAGSTLEKVRSEALRLSEEERAELAHSLVSSLDGPADADAASAWDKEILRRLSEIDAGTRRRSFLSSRCRAQRASGA
jgi:putative addiction module component (TIGR02574 family)